MTIISDKVASVRTEVGTKIDAAFVGKTSLTTAQKDDIREAVKAAIAGTSGIDSGALGVAGGPATYKVEIPFSAGNFAGDASMTWTVASGDVYSYGYAYLNKDLMLIYWDIRNSTVGGTLAGALKIKIPDGRKAAATPNSVVYLKDNTAKQAGTCRTIVATNGNETWLWLEKIDDSNFAASSVTGTRGQIVIPVEPQ